MPMQGRSGSHRLIHSLHFHSTARNAPGRCSGTTGTRSAIRMAGGNIGPYLFSFPFTPLSQNRSERRSLPFCFLIRPGFAGPPGKTLPACEKALPHLSPFLCRVSAVGWGRDDALLLLGKTGTGIAVGTSVPDGQVPCFQGHAAGQRHSPAG